MLNDFSRGMIPETTREIIRASLFRVAAEPHRFARVREVRTPARHFLICRDDHETTVVTHDRDLEDLDIIEVNPDHWLLFTIDCANPFYCVGFIASIAMILAGKGIDILVISTFSRDLILVKESERESARAAMLEAGFREHE